MSAENVAGRQGHMLRLHEQALKELESEVRSLRDQLEMQKRAQQANRVEIAALRSIVVGHLAIACHITPTVLAERIDAEIAAKRAELFPEGSDRPGTAARLVANAARK